MTLAWLGMTLSCEAPRHNPLDPKNPDGPFASIAGSVQTLSLPHRSIHGVYVRWSPEGKMVLSDAKGVFLLDHLLPQDGYLCFSSPDYRSDSVKITWQDAKHQSLQMYLNHLPQMEQAAFFSSVLHRYPNLQSYTMTIQTWIQDPDMDIDSVWVEGKTSPLRGRLSYDVTEKSFSKTFSSLELAQISLAGLVGQELTVHLADVFGYYHLVGVITLKRLVLEEVAYVQPSSYAITSSRPRLQWKKLQPGFPFSYLLEVYTDEMVATRIWRKADISSDAVEWTVDQELGSGDYFWVIWCVDEFGNRSRSKPASFTVP